MLQMKVKEKFEVNEIEREISAKELDRLNDKVS